MKSGNPSSAHWSEAQKKEMQQILDDEKEVEETRKILTEKIEKIMERGEKLDDLEERATALEQEAVVFKEHTLDLKKAEQTAQSREYSLFMSWLGIGTGFVGGLLAGYAWPIALLMGGVTGLGFYGLMRTFTSLNQKVDNVAKKISPYLPTSPFAKETKERPHQSFLPGFEQVKAKLTVVVTGKKAEAPPVKSTKNNP